MGREPQEQFTRELYVASLFCLLGWFHLPELFVSSKAATAEIYLGNSTGFLNSQEQFNTNFDGVSLDVFLSDTTPCDCPLNNPFLLLDPLTREKVLSGCIFPMDGGRWTLVRRCAATLWLNRENCLIPTSEPPARTAPGAQSPNKLTLVNGNVLLQWFRQNGGSKPIDLQSVWQEVPA